MKKGEMGMNPFYEYNNLNKFKEGQGTNGSSLTGGFREKPFPKPSGGGFSNIDRQGSSFHHGVDPRSSST